MGILRGRSRQLLTVIGVGIAGGIIPVVMPIPTLGVLGLFLALLVGVSKTTSA